MFRHYQLISVIFPDIEEFLFPGTNRLLQKNQGHPVLCRICRLYHLSTEDDARLSKERVFCHELEHACGKVCQRRQKVRGGGLFCPGVEVVMERLKTMASQAPDTGEKPKHSVRSSFEEMSE